MKKMVMMSICALTILFSSGCMSMRTNTKGRSLRAGEMIQFTTANPVAVKNISSTSGDVVIGKWIGWKVYGDYQKFTDSCIESLKMEFQKRNIRVSKNATKSLELSVFQAGSRQGAVMFEASASLLVKTGSGIERQYMGRQKYGNGYGTTAAIELALAYCVEQMLNDKDIVAYLKY